jgi:Fur family ferric uptake transcriptional regulator
MPDVSVSTVYRTLEVLERLGQVEHVHLGHGPSLYHLSDRRHVHLLCRRCDTVIELPDTYLAGLADRLADDHGFVLEPRHFALLGTCSRCAAGLEADA